MKKILCRTDEPFLVGYPGFGVEIAYGDKSIDPCMYIVPTCVRRKGDGTQSFSCNCINKKELLSSVDIIIRDLNKLKDQINSKAFRKKLEGIKVKHRSFRKIDKKKETAESMKQFEEVLKKMKEELGISSIHVVQNGEEPKEIK